MFGFQIISIYHKNKMRYDELISRVKFFDKKTQ